MADRQRIQERVRKELGDFRTTFRDVFLGTSELDYYDLSSVHVTDAVLVADDGATQTTLAEGTDYRLDARQGRVQLLGSWAPFPNGVSLIVTGSGGGMLSDEDLDELLTESLLQHANGRTVRTRYRGPHGFIRYRDEPLTLESLPPVEEKVLALLVVVQALWMLATDAAGDIDIVTPDGTHVSRGQRYDQILRQLDLVQTRYEELCHQLNVGMDRIEMFDLRRVSRSTGRLVPLFVAKEYDDYSLPTRKIPSVDARDEDASGVPSIAYWGWW